MNLHGMWLAFQVVTSAGMGIDPAWAIAGLTTIIGTLSTVIGILYRNQVKAAEAESRRAEAESRRVSDESRRKDELIDKLVRQIGRTADVQDRTVSLVERTGPRR